MAKQRFQSKVRGTPEFKRRQRRIALRKAADPLAPELNAAANLRYGDAERGIQSETRISDAASQRIPGFFAEYQQRLSQLRGAQQAGYDAARQDIERMSATSRASSEQGTQQALQQAQQQANVTGGTVDVQAIPRAAGAVATRQDASNVFSGAIRSRQAEAGTHALGREAVAEGEKINQLLEERKRRRQSETKLSDLLKEKGEFKVAKREDIVGARHKRILERKAFGLDVTKAEQDALEKAASFKQKESDLKFDRRAKRRDQALAERRENRLSEGGSGGGGGRTPAQVRTDKKNRNKARADVVAFNESKGGRLSKHTENGKRLRERAINGLMADYGYSKNEARRIVYAQVGFKSAKKIKKRLTTAGS